MEAIDCGTPVVALRVGGVPEAAPDGQGAILCGSQDGVALTEAIIKLRNLAQLRERLADAGRDMVHVRNRLSSFSGLFAEIYRECVSSRENAQRKQSALAT